MGRPRQKGEYVYSYIHILIYYIEAVREIRACAAANFSHLFAVMAGHTTIVKCWSFKAESAANAVSSRALTASMQSQCNFATVENIM